MPLGDHQESRGHLQENRPRLSVLLILLSFAALTFAVTVLAQGNLIAALSATIAALAFATWILFAAFAPKAARELTLLAVVLVPLAGLTVERVLNDRLKASRQRQSDQLRAIGAGIEAQRNSHPEGRSPRRGSQQ